MIIQGLQKLTLLDYPGVTACTVFLAGCNFRCPFCHNASLVLPSQLEENDTLTEEELLAFLKKRAGILEGVCFTGGEPLLRGSDGLIELFSKIHALGYKIKLDTNGYLSDRLKEVLASGTVDYVAMDIKNSPHRYAETSGVAVLDVSRIRESISALAASGIPHEYRTTVTREYHTVEDIAEIKKMIDVDPDAGYFLQVYRDSDRVLSPGLHAPEREVLLGMAAVSGGELRGDI